MSRLFAGTALAALLFLCVAPAGAQTNAPTFSKDYLVTGDYLVANVGLKGTGGRDGFTTRDLEIAASAIPDGAEPIAAFLYWATVVTQNDKASALVGAKFRGFEITKVSKVLNPLGIGIHAVKQRIDQGETGLDAAEFHDKSSVSRKMTEGPGRPP